MRYIKGLMLLSGTLAALLALSTRAEPSANANDCAKARDPARCEGRLQALDTCQALKGRQKQQCLYEKLPPPDCSKADDPQRCLRYQQARAACHDKSGKEWRTCLRAQQTR